MGSIKGFFAVGSPEKPLTKMASRQSSQHFPGRAPHAWPKNLGADDCFWCGSEGCQKSEAANDGGYGAYKVGHSQASHVTQAFPGRDPRV